MKYFLQTFGCQMNISDSERIDAFLQDIGWQKTEVQDDADLVIVNSCSVRQKAEDRVVGLIKNLGDQKKKNPCLKIAVTGCMIRVTGARPEYKETGFGSQDKLFSWIPELDFVFRIEDLPKLGDILTHLYPSFLLDKYFDDYSSYFQITPKYSSATQAYVPIMTGCNEFCAYCIVPYARGREVSRSLEEILFEVKDLAQKGIKEITLLGQIVNNYVLDKGKEKGKTDFVVLLEKIHNIPGIERIRFTSNHPRYFPEDLIQSYSKLPKLCNYIHLPVQSGDDEILKKMNRKYTTNEYRQIINKLHKKIPDISISTDIIVGFPGETEEQFNHTLELVRDLQFDLIYLAEYSPRKGTYAADHWNDNVSHEEKKRRWHELNNLLKKIILKKNQKYVGKIVEVLIEEEKNGKFIGKTEHWKTVRFKRTGIEKIGDIVPVKVKEAKTWILEGEVE